MTEIVARLPFAPNVKMKHGGPLVRIPTIWFELDKHYTETRMQLTLSDSDLIFDSSNVKFSGLQYRGFAFFSAEGLVEHFLIFEKSRFCYNSESILNSNETYRVEE